MRILEIAFTLSPGGAERFVVDLSNELSKQHNVTLLVLKDCTKQPEIRDFYRNEVSQHVHYASLGLGDGLTPLMWVKIYNFIKTHNPDVVHFHGGPMPYWMMVPMLFSKKCIKFVQTIHSDIHNGYNNLLYKILVLLLGNNKRLRFVALSETNYTDLIHLYPKVLATCIFNGRAPMVSSSKFDSVKLELNSYKRTENTKIFLHVARCHEVKNQKRLIAAFNKLSQERDAILVIIGGGFDTKLGQELKALANEFVYFIGPKNNISDYQLLSHAFCLSSDFEGMPITIIEALLCGTPIVSTPVCGAIDVIKNGFNGVLSRSFSFDDYYTALKYMYDNNTSLAKQSRNEICDNPYTIKKSADKYVVFFQK